MNDKNAVRIKNKIGRIYVYGAVAFTVILGLVYFGSKFLANLQLTA
jgi:hypothetical protein